MKITLCSIWFWLQRMIFRNGLGMNTPCFGRRPPLLSVFVVFLLEGLLILTMTNRLLGEPLDHWTWRNPQPQGDDLVAVTYGGGVFVAISWSDAGTILRSADGVNWSLCPSRVLTPLYGVAHGNGQFVVVGVAGMILTSSEGSVWNERQSGTQSVLFGVTYGGGQFVAIGQDGTILSSTNGVNWSSRTPITEASLLNISYGNGEFVVVGYGGAIITSTNGENWVSRSSPTSKDLVGIAYGGGQFIAVDPMKGIVSSTNGVDWRSSEVAVPGVLNLNRIAYGNGKFVAVDGYGMVISSTNGLDWTLSVSGTARALHGVTWGNGLYVSVGNAGTMASSSDGLGWSVRSSGAYPELSAMAYGKGAFVAAGSGGAILSSPDRIRWTPRESGSTNSLQGVVYGAGRFVAVGWHRTIVASDDGNTWVKREPPPFGPLNIEFDLGAVAYGGGRFVALGLGLDTMALSSTNGMDWEYGDISGPGGVVQSVAYGNGQFVALGYRDWFGSYTFTSIDGVHWSLHAPIDFKELRSIAYGNGLFIAVGEAGLVMISSDGSNWIRQTSGLAETVSLRGATCGNGEFVVLSTGPVYSSPDGTNWTAHASTHQQLISVTYAGNHFLGVGFNGAILESDAAGSAVQPRLEAVRFLAPGQFRFALAGSVGQSYLIQASTNLTDWTPLLDVMGTNPAPLVEDCSLTNFAFRCYRAIVP